MKALQAFPETENGRAVLKRMRLSGFAPTAPSDYDRAAWLLAGSPEAATAEN